MAAAAVVAVALLVSGTAMLMIMDRSLHALARSEADLVASQVADELATGAPPDQAVLVDNSAVTLVQVLDDDGAVLAATAPLDGLPPLAPLRPAAGTEVVVEMADPEIDIGSAAVVASGVATPHGDRVVLVAEPLDAVERTVDAARESMAVGAPLLVLVAGGATAVAAGRALRPVERMRAQVDGLTDRELGRRLSVPAVHDEVGRLAVTLNAMLARLQAARSAQRQFIADASHELRSPLATIVAGLELVRGRDERDTTRIAAMREDADRIERLVEDLLLLARADERGLPCGDGEVDLDEILYAEQLRLRSISAIDVVVDVDAVRVHGDRSQLARAVRNLVDNAVRHCAGTVELRLHREDGAVVLAVGDDGPGIPADDRERVVRRFVRLDAGRGRAAGGAGLGLAIVDEVARAHGGGVTIGESALGGALVRVRLPGPSRDTH
jgi:signal transduction histidine kinase